MFTDMVGSTASAQEDEAMALRVRRQQQKLVRPFFASHQGREVKSMGDGFLVEFDSALQGVQCAVEIQRMLHEHNLSARDASKIRLRIGIHLGDVVHEGDDVVGDSVNIASRIEALADPGGICITDPVFGQVRNKIPNSLEKLEPKTLKNVRFPIDIYRVVLPWDSRESHPGPTGIAVLPFTNISPDSKDEYFADGLTEELITVLSQLRDLRVISRTSVMQFKATTKAVSQIGTELGVSSVLEGSVRKAGNRLRITAQLIDARSDRHLWAKTFDRELDDVFAVQAEIARQVAGALEVELRAAEGAALSTRPVVRPDSYVAYLKGRTLMHQQNDPSYRAAKEQFDLAISLDPKNAAAYSGLSDLIRLHGRFSLGMSAKEAEENGLRFAERALELDPNLAEAHASTAATHWLNYDFVEGEKEFKRALALNPSYSQAHHWYAELLSWQTRTDEALAEWALADASDPLSPFNLSHHAQLLVWLGRYDEALAKIRKLGELQPESVEYHYRLATYYRVHGEIDSARAEFTRLQALEEEPAEKRVRRAEYYAIAGEKEKCRALLREEESSPDPDHGMGPWALAWIYAALGDLDDCFRWLDKAVAAHSVGFHYLRFDPIFEFVRKDPRFAAVLAKANLT